MVWTKKTIETITHYRGFKQTPQGHIIIGEPMPRKRPVFTEEEKRKQPPYPTGCALIEDNNKLVLQKRPKIDKLWPGLLGFSAGGHIAHGEIVEEAIKREILEELGVIAVDIKLVLKGEPLVPNAEFARFFVAYAKITGVLNPNPEEVDLEGTRFYTLEEIKELYKENKLTPDLVTYFKKHLRIIE